ncbi:uncharacterized protein LOC108103982 [Drosophila eugracilis]|uniref:uncharacterized protein LOC108103982 n=1 Tax=Drosophila eugracilis TaxID=29029 RepID=UPI001BD9589A|nr:uncharacterized protein LOC108103982 [Drosophila eugracilis]
MNYQDMCSFELENTGRGSNFEFRFSGTESIPNAVRRYNAMRGAELAQLKRQRETGRSHLPSMPRFCKVRHPGQDVNSMVTSRDLDVVTQLSLDSNPLYNEDEDDNNNDEMNDTVQYPQRSARLCGGAESMKKQKNKSRDRKKISTSNKKNRNVVAVNNGYTFERLKELHREVCEELQTISESTPMPSPEATPRPPSGPKSAIKQRKIRLKRRQEVPRKRQDLEREPAASQGNIGYVSIEDYHNPQPKWVDIMPSAMMSQAINVNVCQVNNATPYSAYEFMEQNGTIEPEPLTPFFLEDSDLENEYADRQGYLRYVEPRPRLTSSELDHADRNPIQPCFVELENRPHRVSLLRSLTPMRYTSQRSEETLRTRPAARYPDQEVDVLPLELRKAQNPRKGSQRQALPSDRKAGKFRRNNVMVKGNKKNAPNPKSRLSARSVGGDEAVPVTMNPPNPPSPLKEVVTSPERQNKRRKPKPIVVYSKSLEDLKFEKLGIYNKITLTQERIINALDKLQNSLLQLQVPTCSAQERLKRQRNAFEFCVRFSRNFLYPLKGMIDDVRLTTVASFNSATSNEACQRVVCVYGLMQQSIQTYQRQLRYFLLEKVPQKLSALIEMIYTMTNCCLDKGMLDRNDPVVECLLERCTRFLSFIEDMQEERFKLAREAMRRLHKGPKNINTTNTPAKKKKKKSSRANPTRAPTVPRQEKLRTHERYDLKMCLNDLKLYEPRLVPKERQQVDKLHPRTRRPRNTLNITASKPAELSGDLEMQSFRGDDMPTQMQMAGDGGTTSSLSMPPNFGHRGQPIDDVQQLENAEYASREEQLHRALVDALHLVSRSQVQKVLDPLMRSLGVILGEKVGEGGGADQRQ